MGTTTWVEVAERVFCRRYDPVDVTVTAIVGADGVLVADTRCSLAEAREIKEDVARLSTLPVRWVVNTHAHWDHVWGNAEFDIPKLVPPAEFWAHENAPAAFDPGVPDGDVRLPDRLFRYFQPLDIGGRTVELHHLGRGHTDGDVVLWLPTDDLVIAGDMIEQSGPVAYGSDSFPMDWAATLGGLMLMTEGHATYVPGHGNPVGHDFVLGQHEFVRRVADQIADLHADGVPVADALAAGSWPYEKAEYFANAVQRGYAQLSGELS
jgi:glyoxylase-like metal-dependent hydrolase (beta-lactamase superfamily II)